MKGMLCSNSFCQALPEEMRQILCRHRVRFTLATKQEYVFDFEDMQLYLLESGKILTIRERDDGRRKGIEILRPGEFLGLSSLFNRKTNSIVLVPLSKVAGCSFSKESFERWCRENREFACMVLQNLSKRFDKLVRANEHIALDTSEEKIGYVLEENIPELTHEEIALLAGIHRVTTSKTLKKIKLREAIKL